MWTIIFCGPVCQALPTKNQTWGTKQEMQRLASKQHILGWLCQSACFACCWAAQPCVYARVTPEVLDKLLSSLVTQCKDLYNNGIEIRNFGTLRLVPVALEGDLPAQSKLFHCKRNFNCSPNQLCTWCDACDGGGLPFTDFSSGAAWKATVYLNRPWTNLAPMTDLPGAQVEAFLSKDIFHLCHLGVCRTLCSSILCYLADHGHFAAPHAPFLNGSRV